MERPEALPKRCEATPSRKQKHRDWDTLSNGELLRAAEEAGFDVLLTTDTSLPYQQNLKGRKLAIVILSKNRWSLVRPMMQQIANAVSAATPGTCNVIEIPPR
jgi:hypothetical protein